MLFVYCVYQPHRYAWFITVTQLWASLVAQRLKRLPPMRKTWVRSLGWEDPLEKGMATHSSTLAWRIPWREEPGRLHSPWGRKESDTTERLYFTSVNINWVNKWISVFRIHLSQTLCSVSGLSQPWSMVICLTMHLPTCFWISRFTLKHNRMPDRVRL